MLGLLLTVVLVPLTVEVILRAEAKVGAQNEVTTIEACGDRVAHHKNCYPSDPKNAGGALQNQGANSFFPYLPGMIPFGLVNATSGPPELKDARIALSGFTLIVLAGGLLVADTSTRRKWRIFQVVVVLPSGALPMVTGGDDLPVLALMFLALAFASRRRPVWSGLAMGFAGTLKFTAWPLLILLALGEWDRLGRRAILRYSLAVLAVVVPVLGIGIGQNPRAFVLNAIRFPLGLTKVKSPAASPLIGQELVKLFPAAKTELIGVLGLIGVDRRALRALEMATLDPAERGRLQRLRHAACDLAGAGDTFRLSDLPAQPAHLVRAPFTARLRGARARPVESGAVVGKLEETKGEAHGG